MTHGNKNINAAGQLMHCKLISVIENIPDAQSRRILKGFIINRWKQYHVNTMLTNSEHEILQRILFDYLDAVIRSEYCCCALINHYILVSLEQNRFPNIRLRSVKGLTREIRQRQSMTATYQELGSGNGLEFG